MLGDTIGNMMAAEMNEHLGYSKLESYDSDNARNDYKSIILNSGYGRLEYYGGRGFFRAKP
jgi:transposase-like protein